MAVGNQERIHGYDQLKRLETYQERKYSERKKIDWK